MATQIAPTQRSAAKHEEPVREPHRRLGTLLRRDTASFARRRRGKVLVGAVLVAIPLLMLFRSQRLGSYADDSWRALLMAVVLAFGYLISGRLVLTVAVGALTVAITSWTLTPNLSTVATGDATVLARLEQERSMGLLSGLADIAVAQIDTTAAEPVRLAGIGATDETPMEVGSLTKAMTGLVIADSVRRGEVQMDVQVSRYLPELAGSPAGTVSLQELVTHTAGYVEFGPATLARGAWEAPLGRNFVTTGADQLTREVREQDLVGRGTWRYSSLGAATAGRAVAAAAGMSYPDLMRARLFEPLGMSHTAIQTGQALVAGGRSASGLPTQPWVFDAYAPAGGAVSTTADLAKLATALLDRTAPGAAALDPTTATLDEGMSVGGFWFTSAGQHGRTVTWHNGQTAGYSSYLGLDLAHHKAVVVLSDVATPRSTGLGRDLLSMDD